MAIITFLARDQIAALGLPLPSRCCRSPSRREDREVIMLNRAAEARMRCKAELAVVPGSSHLFEEPRTLDTALALAGDWFARFTGAEVRGYASIS